MTILTTLILVIVSVILTVTSVYNVNQTLVAPMYSALTTAPSFIESGQYLDSTNPYMYEIDQSIESVSYTHIRAQETLSDLV